VVVRTLKGTDTEEQSEKLYYATIDGPARDCLTR
jgi:hypothetical protein